MRREFVIQPNCSLSHQGRKCFLCVMGLIMLAISAYMIVLGFWLIAPFMGAEFGVLVYVFNKVAKQCRIVERVVIQEEQLTIYHREARQTATWSFPLGWVRVDLRHHFHPWYRSQLFIGAYGRWVELASFLTNPEKDTLAQALKLAILTERQPARRM